MRHRRLQSIVAIAALAVVASPAGLAAPAPSSSPTDWGASCAVPGSPAPMATAECGPGTSPIAVIDVSGEVYRIELTTPAALEGARALLAGTSAASIPNGVVATADPGDNTPWSWHIDPATLEWAEMTTEVCDGRPTQIQDGVFTYERFCPWSARLVAILGDPGAPQPAWAPDTIDAAEASGGTSSEDRTWSRVMLISGGAYRLHLETGDNLDLTASGCPADVRLLTLDGQPAPGSGDPYPSIPTGDAIDIAWPALPSGVYQLWLSLDCAWTMRFGPDSASAS